MGLDLDYYWQLTPKQFEKYSSAYIKKCEYEFKRQDNLNFMLGQYIWLAMNNPKKYPKKAFTDDNINKSVEKPQSADVMERMARINTLCLGGKIKDDN